MKNTNEFKEYKWSKSALLTTLYVYELKGIMDETHTDCIRLAEILGVTPGAVSCKLKQFAYIHTNGKTGIKACPRYADLFLRYFYR
jgi:hypothetical protein